MIQESVHEQLQRLRETVARQNTAAEPMQPVACVRQDEGAPKKHWYRARERELQAGEQDGRWLWVEYSFPYGQGTLVLRWMDGERPLLWKVDLNARRSMLNPGSKILAPFTEGPFPINELQQLEVAMLHAPHSLWARVLKLALELAAIDSGGEA